MTIIGKRVKLACALRNAWAELSAGSTGRIKGEAKGGFEFESDPCPHCGIRMYMIGLRESDFEVIDPVVTPRKTP